MTQPVGSLPGLQPGIDPRMRQRRLEVRRQEGRRRLWSLVVVGSALAAIGAGLGASRSPLLDVDRVEVRGATRTQHQAIVAAGGLQGRPLMVEVDGPRVARGVETLPWVLRARATRAWPGTVRVDVTERTPAAAVRAGAGWAVVDASGRVLELTGARPAGTPALAVPATPGGPGTALPPSAGDALRVAAALPRAVQNLVAEVVTAPGGEMVLVLAGAGGQVRLGRPEDLEDKLTSAATVLEKANLSRLAVIDVRVPTAPVLTRR